MYAHMYVLAFDAVGGKGCLRTAFVVMERE